MGIAAFEDNLRRYPPEPSGLHMWDFPGKVCEENLTGGKQADRGADPFDSASGRGRSTGCRALPRAPGVNTVSASQRRSTYGGKDAWAIRRMKVRKGKNRRLNRKYAERRGVGDALACRAFGACEACYRDSGLPSDQNERVADLPVGPNGARTTWGLEYVFCICRTCRDIPGATKGLTESPADRSRTCGSDVGHGQSGTIPTRLLCRTRRT